ncbi:MAG: hypothetical protein Q9223_004046 [Gallowayella weberi]
MGGQASAETDMDVQSDSSIGGQASAETVVGERTESELALITDGMETATTELQRSIQNLAVHLMDRRRLTLDAKVEQIVEETVEEILVKMAEMLNMLNEEKEDIEKALETAGYSDSTSPHSDKKAF